MTFNPKNEYIIQPTMIHLKDFDDFPDLYVTRPPYQRKTVWGKKKKQSLMDSLIRQYYVPRLVLRQVRLSEDKTIDEVIDGQQRINTIQEFFADQYPLPTSLETLSVDLAGKRYSDLDPDMRRYISRLEMQADKILQIEEKNNTDHQEIATEIFWRLQQGETLNSMEIAHARLSSRTRNFLVKYADDITFDYETYLPVDDNPDKHAFFKIIDRGNNRMEHLALLARMLLVEQKNGYTDLKDKAIQEMIDDAKADNGIGDDSYEQDPHARTVLRNLNIFHGLFADDPMLAEGGKIKELKREYFVLSFYLLIRHLDRYYSMSDEVRSALKDFLILFHERWRKGDIEDADINRFSMHRQQGANDLQERDIILRHNFLRYLADHNIEIVSKDSQRAFDESQRIAIYRRDKGMCQLCIKDDKTEREASIPWSDYQADHIIPWIQGGETTVDNGRLLCSYHNQSIGAGGSQS